MFTFESHLGTGARFAECWLALLTWSYTFWNIAAKSWQVPADLFNLNLFHSMSLLQVGKRTNSQEQWNAMYVLAWFYMGQSAHPVALLLSDWAMIYSDKIKQCLQSSQKLCTGSCLETSKQLWILINLSHHEGRIVLPWSVNILIACHKRKYYIWRFWSAKKQIWEKWRIDR